MQFQPLVNMKKKICLDDDDFSSWLLENSSTSYGILVDGQKNLSSSVLTMFMFQCATKYHSVAKLDLLQ